jgi:polyphosphate kinase 2 (PPK2 family)
MLVNAGFIMLKYYLDISKKEQKQRLHDRKEDPLKQWKISPIDSDAQKRWKDYSKARNEMLLKTNFKHAPWFVVDAEVKEDAHIAIIGHLLKQINYAHKKKKLLDSESDLVYEASPESIKEKLY